MQQRTNEEVHFFPADDAHTYVPAEACMQQHTEPKCKARTDSLICTRFDFAVAGQAGAHVLDACSEHMLQVGDACLVNLIDLPLQQMVQVARGALLVDLHQRQRPCRELADVVAAVVLGWVRCPVHRCQRLRDRTALPNLPLQLARHPSGAGCSGRVCQWRCSRCVCGGCPGLAAVLHCSSPHACCRCGLGGLATRCLATGRFGTCTCLTRLWLSAWPASSVQTHFVVLRASCVVDAGLAVSVLS